MAGLGPRELDDLLADSSPAARQSLSELVPAVYDELQGLARRFLARERRNHSLQPTALVHEAYMRLATQRETGFVSRAHPRECCAASSSTTPAAATQTVEAGAGSP